MPGQELDGQRRLARACAALDQRDPRQAGDGIGEQGGQAVKLAATPDEDRP
jgi:hypothetical protein